MTYQFLLVAHIAVLGYWLGSELVINSSYRYVCYSDRMPVAERLRLMSHIMVVDQHVRYALVLQVILGTMLAAHLHMLPGGRSLSIAAAVVGVLWLAFIEAVHRLSASPVGPTLAAVDRGSRYFLIIIALALGFGIGGDNWSSPAWLRWKLLLFSGVVLCGVGIRLVLIRQFRTWAVMEREGSSPETNAAIRRTYVQATAILVLLWAFIGAITVISIGKPA
ncbi:MAG: hypothetical protein ACR2RD_10775 [Woeseiaceae bacterium]